MGARATLATALEEALPAESVKVVDHFDNLSPERTYDLVMVGLEEVAPGRVSGSRTVKCAVWVTTAKTNDEDALEDLLGTVLDALDDIAWANWVSAKRSLYDPSGDSAGFPAFNIEIEIEVR